MREIQRTQFRHELSFYGTIAFVVGFFGARLFTTLDPTTVVVRGEVHFHHFWYGLAMVVIAGWLGIAIADDRLSRTLALTFGLGAGFIGDEVGLLLTLENYQSELTETFYVAAIALIVALTLLLRFTTHLKRELTQVGTNERLTQAGVVVGLFSTIFLAFDSWNLAFVSGAIGAATFLLGTWLERRSAGPRLHNS